MAVFRVERNTGYTVMSNHHLRNKELSLKAKGLLSQMLSLPEDWDYTLAGLSHINREKIDAIREAVKELEKAGYIVRSRERDEKGRLRGADYVIYEQPQPREPEAATSGGQPPILDLPTLENPTLDNPTLEKPTQEKPIPISIIKRSAGRSAVAAAAYRSGTKLTNEWDGMTHDYTRKGGIVHAEIMLPAYAPPEFADRSILWNSVEQIEKARDSQLAREIEAALPRELSIEQQLALVRSYVKDNFVDKGMCADFAIHDRGTGNPHVHIMLTVRPLKENGAWGAKCRKAYDLDENGQRIPDGKGGWKNHREDTTNWNDKGNVEIWRAAWAACTNRALEAAGHPALVDHRSYKRQGIDKIPSVHLGPAASQMEKRGIRTDKGEVNRQIAADNKLLKEIKARITRLYNWSKAEAEKPEGQQPSMIDLWEAQQQLKRPDTRTGKIRALQESAALFSFLQTNGIQSMQQLHEKIADMNRCYYDLRGKIVKAERRIAILTERGEMWEQYNQYKSIHKQLAKVKPEKREQFEQRHSRELILYDAAARYLKELKDSGEAITPKAWQREIDQLAAGKQTDTLAMKSMREDLKAVERLRKTAEQLSRQERDKPHDREPER